MTQRILSGGTVLTMDPSQPVASALLIENGTIAAVGSDEEILAKATGGAEHIDLAGRTACPGFIDAHNHFFFSILAALGVDCRTPPITSISDLLEALERAAWDAGTDTWVRGWGYSELNLSDGRHPTIEELDRAAPANPLVVEHASGHICVANSRALAAAGISPESTNPRNGIIERRGRGRRLTGLLHETAAELVDVTARDAIVARDRPACIDAARAVARRYASLGLTTICDPCVPPNVDALYGELLQDPSFQIELIGLGMGPGGKFVAPVERLGPPASSGDAAFSIVGLKYFADGGEQCSVCVSKGQALRGAVRTVVNSIRHRTLLAARLLTAPTSRLGSDGRIHSGIKFYRDGELAGLLERTVGAGLTAAVHAMGNEGIDQVLDAIERTRPNCQDDASFRMEHVMMPDEPALTRIGRLGVAGVVQPRFVHDFGFPLLLTGMSAEFRILAFRDLMVEGVLLAGSSDAPVCDPAVLPAIQSAVTRRTERGDVLDRDQRLSVTEALSLYTINAARVLGIDDRVGSLRPGKDADLVVLDADPRIVRPEEIGDITVDLTMKAGAPT